MGDFWDEIRKNLDNKKKLKVSSSYQQSKQRYLSEIENRRQIEQQADVNTLMQLYKEGIRGTSTTLSTGKDYIPSIADIRYLPYNEQPEVKQTYTGMGDVKEMERIADLEKTDPAEFKRRERIKRILQGTPTYEDVITTGKTGSLLPIITSRKKDIEQQVKEGITWQTKEAETQIALYNNQQEVIRKIQNVRDNLAKLNENNPGYFATGLSGINEYYREKERLDALIKAMKNGNYSSPGFAENIVQSFLTSAVPNIGFLLGPLAGFATSISIEYLPESKKVEEGYITAKKYFKDDEYINNVLDYSIPIREKGSFENILSGLSGILGLIPSFKSARRVLEIIPLLKGKSTAGLEGIVKTRTKVQNVLRSIPRGALLFGTQSVITGKPGLESTVTGASFEAANEITGIISILIPPKYRTVKYLAPLIKAGVSGFSFAAGSKLGSELLGEHDVNVLEEFGKGVGLSLGNLVIGSIKNKIADVRNRGIKGVSEDTFLNKTLNREQRSKAFEYFVNRYNDRGTVENEKEIIYNILQKNFPRELKNQGLTPPQPSPKEREIIGLIPERLTPEEKQSVTDKIIEKTSEGETVTEDDLAGIFKELNIPIEREEINATKKGKESEDLQLQRKRTDEGIQETEKDRFITPGKQKEGAETGTGYSVQEQERELKQPWEMTKAEFDKIKTGSEDYGEMHRQVIIGAIKEGKTIPEEVLKDYPDIKKQISVYTGVEVKETKAGAEIYQEARDKGYVEIAGNRYERQEPIETSPTGRAVPTSKGDYAITGKDVIVDFTRTVKVPAKYAVVEADRLQPSHKSGSKNPNYFIPEAQRRNRSSTKVLRNEARMKAELLDPEKLINTSPNAYFGSPVMNSRGEIIQGNGRGDTIQYYYSTNKKDSRGYKQKLIDDASSYGLSSDDIKKFNKPVLTRIADVSDEKAIELGQYESSELEDITGQIKTVGKGEIARISPEQAREVTAMISTRAGEDNTLKDIIRDAGEKLVRKLQDAGVIRADESELYLDDKGNIKAEGVENIYKVFKQMLFKGGIQELPELFERLPFKVKQGVEKSIVDIISLDKDKSIQTELQNALIGLSELQSMRTTVPKTNFEEWINQADVFTGTPSDRYNETEQFLIKALDEAQNQRTIIKLFNNYKDLVTDKPADLFNPEVKGLEKREGLQKLGASYGKETTTSGKEPEAEERRRAGAAETGREAEEKRGGPGEEGATGKGKYERIDKEIDDLEQRLLKTLGGKLSAGLDPEALSISIQLISKYAEKGIYKLEDILKNVYEKYGKENFRKLFNAIKAGYNGYKTMAEDDEANKMDDYDYVKGFRKEWIEDYYAIETAGEKIPVKPKTSGEETKPVVSEKPAEKKLIELEQEYKQLGDEFKSYQFDVKSPKMKRFVEIERELNKLKNYPEKVLGKQEIEKELREAKNPVHKFKEAEIPQIVNGVNDFYKRIQSHLPKKIAGINLHFNPSVFGESISERLAHAFTFTNAEGKREIKDAKINAIKAGLFERTLEEPEFAWIGKNKESEERIYIAKTWDNIPRKIFVSVWLPEGDFITILPDNTKTWLEKNKANASKTLALEVETSATEPPVYSGDQGNLVNKPEQRTTNIVTPESKSKFPKENEQKYLWKRGLERDFIFDPNSTENEGRFRLYPPGDVDNTTYKSQVSIKTRDIPETEGIRYLLADNKTGERVIQTIRFDKKIWTEEKAKEWWNENKDKFKFNTEASTELSKEVKKYESAEDFIKEIDRVNTKNTNYAFNSSQPKLTADEKVLRDAVMNYLSSEEVETLYKQGLKDKKILTDFYNNIKQEKPVTSYTGRELPAELSKAKPRYNYGSKGFQPEFSNDIDMALFITSQETKSIRDADYRQFLKDNGLTDKQIEQYGKEIRETIKSIAKNEEGGTVDEPRKIKIPNQNALYRATGNKVQMEKDIDNKFGRLKELQEYRKKLLTNLSKTTFELGDNTKYYDLQRKLFDVEQEIKDTENAIANLRPKVSEFGEDQMALFDREASRIEAERIAGRDEIEAVIDRLKKTKLPISGIELVSDNEMKRILEEEMPASAFTKDVGTTTPLGFAYKNKVYINYDKARIRTPIHEFGHIWCCWVREKYPGLWREALKIVERASDYVNKIKAAYPELEGNELLEEALMQLVCRKGADLYESEKSKVKSEKGRTLYQRFMAWLKRFWDKVKSMFGPSAGRLKDLDFNTATLDDLATAIAGDLLSGKKLHYETRLKNALQSMGVETASERVEVGYPYRQAMFQWQDRGSGGFNYDAGLSNRAIRAQDAGMIPGSIKLSKILKKFYEVEKIDGDSEYFQNKEDAEEFIKEDPDYKLVERSIKVPARFLTENAPTDEWHHHGSGFTGSTIAVNYYDLKEVVEWLDTDEAKEELKKFEKEEEQRGQIVHTGEVTFTEYRYEGSYGAKSGHNIKVYGRVRDSGSQYSIEVLSDKTKYNTFWTNNRWFKRDDTYSNDDKYKKGDIIRKKKDNVNFGKEIPEYEGPNINEMISEHTNREVKLLEIDEELEKFRKEQNRLKSDLSYAEKENSSIVSKIEDNITQQDILLREDNKRKEIERQIRLYNKEIKTLSDKISMLDDERVKTIKNTDEYRKIERDYQEEYNREFDELDTIQREIEEYQKSIGKSGPDTSDYAKEYKAYLEKLKTGEHDAWRMKPKSYGRFRWEDITKYTDKIKKIENLVYSNTTSEIIKKVTPLIASKEPLKSINENIDELRRKFAELDKEKEELIFTKRNLVNIKRAEREIEKKRIDSETRVKELQKKLKDIEHSIEKLENEKINIINNSIKENPSTADSIEGIVSISQLNKPNPIMGPDETSGGFILDNLQQMKSASEEGATKIGEESVFVNIQEQIEKLRQKIKDEKDPVKKLRLQRQLFDLRKVMGTGDTRIMFEKDELEEEKKARVLTQPEFDNLFDKLGMIGSKVIMDNPPLRQGSVGRATTKQSLVTKEFKEMLNRIFSNSKTKPFTITEIQAGKLYDYSKKLYEKMKRERLKEAEGKKVSAISESEERSFPQQVLESSDVSGAIKDNLRNLKYNPISNQRTVNEANKLIDDEGIEGAMRKIFNYKNELTDRVRVAAGEILIKRLSEEGDMFREGGYRDTAEDKYEQAIEVAEKLGERGTTLGQGVQAFSLFSKLTPQGAIYYAEKITATSNKKFVKKIRERVRLLKQIIKQANEEVIDKVMKDLVGLVRDIAKKSGVKFEGEGEAKKVPVKKKLGKEAEDKLAKRIESAVKSKDAKYDAIKEMVNTLFDIAKENELIPKKAPKTTENILGVIANALRSEDRYRDVWQKAQKIVKSRFADDENALDRLDEYFNYFLEQPFSEGQLTRVVKGTIKEFEINLSDIVRKHYTVAEETGKTLAAKLVEKAGLDGEQADKLAAAIQRKFAELSTERKAKIIEAKVKTPIAGTGKKIKRIYDRIIEDSNLGMLSNEELRKYFAEHYKLKRVSPEQAMRITEMANAVQEAPEGFQRERKAIDMMTYIKTMNGISYKDLFENVFYANILSGLTTHGRNLLYNFVNTAFEFLPTQMFKPTHIKQMLMGVYTGFGKKGFAEAWSILANGYGQGLIKYDSKTFNWMDEYKFTGPWRVFNGVKYITRALAAADRFFYWGLNEAKSRALAYSIAKEEGLRGKELTSRMQDILHDSTDKIAEARLQAEKEGLTGLDLHRRVNEITEQGRPEEIREKADKFAARGTLNYTPRGLLGYITRGMQGFQRIPVFGKVFKFVVMPFTNIVANVFNNNLDFTPYGFKRAFWGYTGEGEGMKADEYWEQMGRATFGTLAMGTLAYLAISGDEDDDFTITATGTGDYKKNEQLRQTGWRPYSFRLFGRWWSYMNTPLVIPFSLAGHLHDIKAYKHKEIDWDVVSTAIILTGQSILDQSFLSGLADFFQTIGSEDEVKKERWLEKTFSGTGTSFVVPNLVKQLTTWFDDTQYEANTVSEMIIRNIGIAETTLGLKPKLNILGEPIKSDGLLQRVIGGQKDTSKSDKSRDRIWNFIVSNSTYIPVPSKNTVIYDKELGKDRSLTPEEYYEYVENSGKLIMQGIGDNMEFLQELDSESRRDIVEDIIHNARRMAKEDIQGLSKTKLVFDYGKLLDSVKRGIDGAIDKNDDERLDRGKNILEKLSENPKADKTIKLKAKELLKTYDKYVGLRRQVDVVNDIFSDLGLIKTSGQSYTYTLTQQEKDDFEIDKDRLIGLLEQRWEKLDDNEKLTSKQIKEQKQLILKAIARVKKELK